MIPRTPPVPGARLAAARRRAARAVCQGACVLLVASPAALGAQARAETAPAVTLQGVVTAALANNSQIQAAAFRADGARGTLLASHAPFDLQLSTTVARNRETLPDASGQSATQAGTGYQVSLSKQLRSGITIAPTLEVASTEHPGDGTPAIGSALTGVNVRVPLLHDRGGAVSSAGLRVAELQLETSVDSWKAAVAEGTNAAASAYWSYVAAARRAEVQRDAEARAQRLLDETTELVLKEERARADLQPLRATVASRRAARVLAEQSVEEARVQLGILMGLDGPAILLLGVPATDFPQPGDTRLGTPASVRRLSALALERRPDVAAQRVSARAWDLRLSQAQHAEQPRLDLELSLGYRGYAQGSTYEHLVSPLYRNVPGVNATVQLRYAGAASNSLARGRALQEDAGAQQQRLALRDVVRQVETQVFVAAHGVDRSAEALSDAEEAVGLYRASVENEQRKLRLGMNTLFDVLTSEDALTNALLAAINNRRVYATALVSLRLATGTLARLVGDQATVDATSLLAIP